MKHFCYTFFFIVVTTFYAFGEDRAFLDLYPNSGSSLLSQALLKDGILEITENNINNDSVKYKPKLIPPLETQTIFQKRKLGFLIESVKLIPIQPKNNNLTVESILYSLQKIQRLKGRLYHSYTKNKDIPLFNNAYRIESLQSQKPIPDPLSRPTQVQNEEMFLLLDDANFGKSYYKATIYQHDKGLIYTLINIRTLNFGIIPVISEQNLIVSLYIEPLKEGLFIYGIAGAEVPKFISSQVHMPSAIRKRLDVFIDWLVDGLGQ
jgi:hypothetical protein